MWACVGGGIGEVGSVKVVLSPCLLKKKTVFESTCSLPQK